MKQGIVFNLEDLRAWIIEWLAERATSENFETDVLRRLAMSDFLIWISRKVNGDGQTKAASADNSDEQVRPTTSKSRFEQR